MTCIAGIVDNGKVFMGGDSAGVGGGSMHIRSDRKVFKKNGFIFGFTSSFRMGQLIKYKLQIPESVCDIDDYMHTDFIDSIIGCFKANGYAEIKDGVVSGGTFLVGFKGALYQIDSDFQVAQCVENYDSVGCGKDAALGCLFGLEGGDLPPDGKILKALKASERFSSGVRGPFYVIEGD